MPRIRRYIETDVVTEARTRIRHIFEVFDSVAVCFSGGKDSLTCLHLSWQVAQELGRDHVDVIFRDEELIPDAVINFVDAYRRKPWVRMRWFAIPLEGDKFVLGKRCTYVQWDRDRPWVREPPPWSIRLPDEEYQVCSQYTADEICARGLPGSVAFITGIRAAESLVRYRSVVNKLHENYICTPVGSTPKARVKVAKPIYDWSENDIFKWLGENRIRWCPQYDAQHLAGLNLRVSTPLHAECSKRIGKLRAVDPEFYDRVLAVFPEMALQDRYWNDYDGERIRRQYADGFPGCRRYVTEQIEDPEQAATARKRIAEFEVLHRNDPEAYPADHLLKALISGSIKRVITPVDKKTQQRARKRRRRR